MNKIHINTQMSEQKNVDIKKKNLVALVEQTAESLWSQFEVYFHMRKQIDSSLYVLKF